MAVLSVVFVRLVQRVTNTLSRSLPNVSKEPGEILVGATLGWHEIR